MPNITEWKKEKIKKFIHYDTTTENPIGERMTFISNDEEIRRDMVKACKIWYTGNGDEILNYYTHQETMGFNKNPIFNRNARKYFWGLSCGENFKRLHTGLPKVIVKTITNIVGYPQIKVDDGGLWESVEEETNFRNKLVEEGRALTLAEGYGAWKVNVDTELSDKPLIEYYEAENCDYIVDKGVLVGIIFTTYYILDGKNYILFETRYKAHGNSYIDYDFFALSNKGYISQAPLEMIGLNENSNVVIEGINEILAVPSKYFYNILYKDYGESIFAGKLDLFDMLDEIWSQASQTNRVSSPIVWYNPDVMERDKDGRIATPSLWNRQLMTKAGVPDGEGHINTDIITDQPDLNFDKYGGLALDVLSNILTGVLSPATMGIDVAKKDNADAQREKEKVSIMTRNNIIAPETIMLRKLIKIVEILYQWMHKGVVEIKDFKIDIQYSEFASPSLENKLQNLSTAWANGTISTERYVELLWGDSLSDEEKMKEIEWLDENRKQESDFMNSLNSGEEDENGIREDVPNSSGMEEETTELN